MYAHGIVTYKTQACSHTVRDTIAIHYEGPEGDPSHEARDGAGDPN
jgi:hypothetical protein